LERLVYNGRWENAIRRLHATNNSLSSPAASVRAVRAACVLAINQPAVSIKLIERSVVSAPGTKDGFIPSRQEKPANGSR